MDVLFSYYYIVFLSGLCTWHVKRLCRYNLSGLLPFDLHMFRAEEDPPITYLSVRIDLSWDRCGLMSFYPAVFITADDGESLRVSAMFGLFLDCQSTVTIKHRVWAICTDSNFCWHSAIKSGSISIETPISVPSTTGSYLWRHQSLLWFTATNNRTILIQTPISALIHCHQ